LEAGPGTAMGGLIKQHPGKKAEQLILNSLRHPKERLSDLTLLHHTLGALWLAGKQIDWAQLYAGGRPQRIPLPTYPFEGKRYWIGPKTERVFVGEMSHEEGHSHAPAITSVSSTSSAIMAEPVKGVTIPPPISRDQALTSVIAKYPPEMANGHGQGVRSNAVQQIIAQQLRISAEQLNIMSMQLELLRNEKTGKR
jgi:acyl transferase domain-containing protein